MYMRPPDVVRIASNGLAVASDSVSQSPSPVQSKKNKPRMSISSVLTGSSTRERNRRQSDPHPSLPLPMTSNRSSLVSDLSELTQSSGQSSVYQDDDFKATLPSKPSPTSVSSENLLNSVGSSKRNQPRPASPSSQFDTIDDDDNEEATDNSGSKPIPRRHARRRRSDESKGSIAPATAAVPSSAASQKATPDDKASRSRKISHASTVNSVDQDCIDYEDVVLDDADESSKTTFAFVSPFFTGKLYAVSHSTYK
jgi:hypothetical protein